MADPKIFIRRSATPSKVPTTDQLALGELAINTYDGKLYLEQDQGAVGVGVTIIAVNPWSVGVGSTAYNIYFTAGFVGIGITNPTSALTVAGSGTSTSQLFVTGVSTFTGNVNLGGELRGPAEFIIDPAAVGDNTGAVRIKGDLLVDGTQTIINSATIELADFIVGIASTATTDLLADGAGIKIGPDNTLLYDHTNTALKSSENLNLASGKTYKIDGTDVLSSTTLGSGVVNSSLTSVGTLTSLNVSNAVTAATASVSTINLSAVDITSTSTTTTTTVATSVASVSATVCRSAVFQVQAVQGTNYNMTTINVLHDGSETYMTEYGTINQPIGIATFSTDIDAGSLRLLAHPASNSSTTFKVLTKALDI